MKKSRSFSFIALLAFALSSCAESDISNQTKAPDAPKSESYCLNFVSEKSPCRPNLHLFFSSPNLFNGKDVTVSAFATYSPRGTLLAYPSSSSACDSLDNAGFEVFLADNLPSDVQHEIEKFGVSRILLTGHVLSNDAIGALPVVGRIDKATVLLYEGSGLVLRKDPKTLETDHDESFFGKLIKPNCFALVEKST